MISSLPKFGLALVFRVFLISGLSLLLVALPSHVEKRRLQESTSDPSLSKVVELARLSKWNQLLQTAPALAQKAEAEGRLRTATGLHYYLSQAHIAVLDYGKAMQSASKAKALALQDRSWGSVAVADYVIAHICMQLGNYPEAEQSGREMLSYAAKGDPKRSRPFMMHSLMGAILRLNGKSAESRAEYSLAIREADAMADLREKSNALEQASIGLVKDGEFDLAEAFLIESYRLRRLLSPAHLGLSFRHLGRLRQLQGRFQEALRFYELALASPGMALLPYQVRFFMAQTYTRLGDRAAALRQLEKAVGEIRDLRMNLPFGDEFRASSEASLQDVFALYSELSATAALESPNQRMLEQSLLAALDNRAASLRARTRGSETWRQRLPAEYWATLRELRSAQLEAIQQEAPAATLAHLRSRLAELETAAALESDRIPESTLSLQGIRQALAPGEILLVYHVGEARTWRWALTKDRLDVQPLPDRKTLTAQIKRFSSQVQQNGPELAVSGNILFESLFAKMSDLDAQQLITIIPDDTLFELPFAALVRSNSGGKPVYLVESHAVRLAPTAILKPSHKRVRSGGFLGVGDPITNRADSRWASHTPWWRRVFAPNPHPLEAPRLAGSSAELEKCKRLWNENESSLLVGGELTREKIVNSLQKKPLAIHFATHVFQPPDYAGAPVILLGLSANGEPDVLTDADITATMVPVPRFVVLSGCGSGRGRLAPGTGLLGLTRAWLVAGADSVMATLWSIIDNSGGMFEEFYGVLRAGQNNGDARVAAQALRKAQLRAIAQGGAEARPYSWGAYFVIGVL